ncbi:MAG: Gfo/Idh/MocA family oxidoreductase [Chloroflexi bacterium]|nr:Gfo/Idh/MocA family oxidoreductase [Chloroflexota bacterium]
MSSVIKIGVVGCGNIVTGHLHAFKTLRARGFDSFRITALCDQRIEYARMFRKRGEGPPQRPPQGLPWDESPVYVSDIHDDVLPAVYADWHEMIESAPLDAVLILAPIFLHHQIALASFRAGKHVFSEKPLAISVRAGQRMVEVARARGLSLGVGEAVRYGEATRGQKYAIDAGRIGAIQMWLSAGMGASGDAIFDGTPWRHRKLQAGGGFAVDAGVHRFHQIRYLCGEIREISALAPRVEPRRFRRDAAGEVIEVLESELDDAYFAHLKFASGAVGALVEGRAGHGEATGLKDGPAIYGTKGCLKGGEVILDGGRRESVKGLFAEQAPADLKERWFPRGVTDRYALEQLDFLRSIESGKPMEADGEEGVRDLACSFAVLESAMLNRPVEIADVLSGRVDVYQREVNEYYGLRADC